MTLVKISPYLKGLTRIFCSAIEEDFKKSLMFKDIEILNKANGSPYVNNHSEYVLFSTIYISISHIKEYATAVAVKK